MSVSVSAQISSSRCQSVELRARRETSRPSTIPAWPMPTSATRRLEALAIAADAPDWPRSLSMTMTRSSGQPSATARWRSAYWRLVLSVFSNTWRSVRLPHVQVSVAPQVAGLDLLSGFSGHAWTSNGSPAPCRPAGARAGDRACRWVPSPKSVALTMRTTASWRAEQHPQALPHAVEDDRAQCVGSARPATTSARTRS